MESMLKGKNDCKAVVCVCVCVSCYYCHRQECVSFQPKAKEKKHTKDDDEHIFNTQL